MKTINLKQRWKRLAEKAGADKKESKFIFKIIKGYYKESHRRYHTLEHIESMLILMDEYIEKIQHPFPFELAIWFHDIIYQPSGKDNEEESAILAEKTLASWNQSTEIIELVGQYIRSTSGHFPRIDSEDCKLFLDLDLSILGKDEGTYQAYREAIREEYNIYPDEFYYPARKKVMNSFITRERIYFTDFMHKRFEEQARENILNEIGGN